MPATAPPLSSSNVDWAADAVFGAAWAYDLAFAWDVSKELDVVWRLACLPEGGANGTGTVRLLVPACGTGRHAIGLAQRGAHVDAFDINRHMLARANAERGHAHITYREHDMRTADTGLAGDCDAAFTFTNSFRYLLDDAGIAGHLKAVRMRLKPGARYVFELGLNQGAEHVGQKISWRARHPDVTVEATWLLDSIAPPIAHETARLTVHRPGAPVETFVAPQPQRLWSLAALQDAVRSAGLLWAGTFDMKGRPPAQPDAMGRYYAVACAPVDNGE